MRCNDPKITKFCHFWYSSFTCAEDRATLESDLSADIGGYTSGQGLGLLPASFPAQMEARKAINSGGSGAEPLRLSTGYPYKTAKSLFLRDDIYDIIMDPDKTKWRDLMVEVEWTKSSIQPLLAFRISRAIDPSATILSFKDAWFSAFKEQAVRYGKSHRKNMPIFNYITKSTHIRPRDYIRYLQACSSEVIIQNTNKITSEIVVKADRAFSNFFRSELEDEIHGILPDIGEIMNIISQLKKPTFKYDDFRQLFLKKVSQGAIDKRDPEFVLKILFNFSVIGNQPSQLNVQVFRYLDNDARFFSKEAICVHRGLYKALQIL